MANPTLTQPCLPSAIAFYLRSTPGVCSIVGSSPGSLCQFGSLACGLEWLRLEYYERAWQVGSAAGWDQVAHCPRLATGGCCHRHPTWWCVWMRHQAPPSLARAGLGQNTQFLTARDVRESVSPARLTGGATTRLRGREKSLKVSHFLRAKKRRKSEEKFLLAPLLVKSVPKRADLGKAGEVRLTPEALHQAAVGALKREQSPAEKKF